MENEIADTAISRMVHSKTVALLRRILDEAPAEASMAVISGMIAALTEIVWEGRAEDGSLEGAIETWTAMGAAYLKQYAKIDGEHADH